MLDSEAASKPKRGLSFSFHLRFQRCRDFFQSESAWFRVDKPAAIKSHRRLDVVKSVDRIGEGE